MAPPGCWRSRRPNTANSPTWACPPNASPSCRIPSRSRSSSRGRSGDAFATRLGVEGPLVAYLGKLTPRKRVDLLVRAFAVLRAPGATLVVAGNDMGGGDAAHATARQLGVEERVIFTGLVEGRDRLELLASADVVVYPSEHEIFGLVPLEALLAGTPVVVTNDSGCGEVVAFTGGGLIVPGEADSIRSAIDHILEAPGSLAHGCRGSRQTGEDSLRAGRRLRAARRGVPRQWLAA